MMKTVQARLAKGLSSPGWADQRLRELTRVRKELEKVVANLDSMAAWEVNKAIRAAGSVGWMNATDDLKKLGLPVTYGAYSNTASVLMLAKKATGMLVATHTPMVRQALDVYRNAVLAEIQTGLAGSGITQKLAAQRVLDRFAHEGITGFTDKAGRKWALDSYAEMATRSTAAQATMEQSAAAYRANGRDLVVVSDSPAECPLCRPFEGMVLSLSGAGGKATLADAVGAGLFHANCTHRITAYVEGLTKPMKNTADPGRYAASQKQRAYERQLREWKRREAVALDPKSRAKAIAHQKAIRAKLDAHTTQHDLMRRRDRETIRKPKALSPDAPKAMAPPTPPPAPVPKPVPAPAPKAPVAATKAPVSAPAAPKVSTPLPTPTVPLPPAIGTTATGAADVKGFAHSVAGYADDDLKAMWAAGAKNDDVGHFLKAYMGAEQRAAYDALTKHQKIAFHNHLKKRHGVAPKTLKAKATSLEPGGPFSPMAKLADNAATVKYQRSAAAKLKATVDWLKAASTPKARAAYRFLTSYKGGGYSSINRIFRKSARSSWASELNGHLPKHADFAGLGIEGRGKLLMDALDDAFDGSRLQSDAYLFRCFRSTSSAGKSKIVNAWDNLIGAIFEDKGFISTSMSGQQQLHGGWGDILCIIRAPKGTKGIALELVSSMHESELVLPPSRFRIIGKWKVAAGEKHPLFAHSNVKYVVEMEVIEQPWLNR